jgi:hypothetical protein
MRVLVMLELGLIMLFAACGGDTLARVRDSSGVGARGSDVSSRESYLVGCRGEDELVLLFERSRSKLVCLLEMARCDIREISTSNAEIGFGDGEHSMNIELDMPMFDAETGKSYVANSGGISDERYEDYVRRLNEVGVRVGLRAKWRVEGGRVECIVVEFVDSRVFWDVGGGGIMITGLSYSDVKPVDEMFFLKAGGPRCRMAYMDLSEGWSIYLCLIAPLSTAHGSRSLSE